jgi:hypothetical protein
MEEAGSGHEDSSHNILTLDALQVLSRSQVTPELSMSMRIRPICVKSTYIHASIVPTERVKQVLGHEPLPSFDDHHTAVRLCQPSAAIWPEECMPAYGSLCASTSNTRPGMPVQWGNRHENAPLQQQDSFRLHLAVMCPVPGDHLGGCVIVVSDG